MGRKTHGQSRLVLGSSDKECSGQSAPVHGTRGVNAWINNTKLSKLVGITCFAFSCPLLAFTILKVRESHNLIGNRLSNRFKHGYTYEVPKCASLCRIRQSMASSNKLVNFLAVFYRQLPNNVLLPECTDTHS